MSSSASSRLRAGYLPTSGPSLPFATLPGPAGDLGVTVPTWSAETLEPLLEHLRIRARRWRGGPLAERADAIAAAAAVWRHPMHPTRQVALSLLTRQTGRAPGLVAESLDFFLGKLSREELLAESLRLGFSDATSEAPRLALHWLAGNTPWPGLESLVAATLAGSASLVKLARSEPYFAGAFAETLAATRPELAEALAVLHWSGAGETWDTRLFPRLDVVVAFGADASLAALRSRIAASPAPQPRLVAHGHRLSAAILGPAAWSGPAAVSTAERVAYDHVLEEQQGCLSPRAVYLVGDGCGGRDGAAGTVAGRDADPARDLASGIADRLAAWERRWPRAGLAPEEAARVQQLRLSARLRGKLVLHSENSTQWTVLLDDRLEFDPAPPARFVWLRHASSLEAAVAGLAAARGVLSTLAFDGFAGPAPAAQRAMAALSPDRLCLPGTMQRPAWGWNHDGASDLAWFLGAHEAR